MNCTFTRNKMLLHRKQLPNKFIAEVKDLREQGIIEKVTEPTDWVSVPAIVNKPSAKKYDSRPPNTALKRSEYPIPTVDHLRTEISNAKVFKLADIKSAFWHVPLDEPSSLLTTFSTPVGRMKWNRMPFGISVAPEEFQRRIDESLEGLEGTKAIADDILIWGDGNTIEEATSNPHSSDPLGRIPFDCRECCAELWDMTLTSSTSKAKTC